MAHPLRGLPVNLAWSAGTGPGLRPGWWRTTMRSKLDVGTVEQSFKASRPLSAEPRGGLVCSTARTI